MSQADTDNCPDEQAHDLKQQNVTTTSIKAKLCRATKGHVDLQGLIVT